MRCVRDSDPVWLRLRVFQTCWGAALLAAALAFVMDVPWLLQDCATAATIAVVPLLGGVLVESRSRFTALSGIMISLGTVLIMMFVGAALALLSTRTPAPMADTWLIKVDRAIVVSAPTVVAAINDGPSWLIDLLRICYAKTGLFLFITLIACHLINRPQVAWRMILIWMVSLVTVSLVAFAVPAFGAFQYVPLEQSSALPAGAGRYYWKALETFRSDAHPILALNRVGAVVSFPSFHTICALLFAQAWRGVRIMSPVSAVLAAIVIVATIPMGGHYVADVLAGVIVWLLCTRIVDRSQHVGDTPIERLVPVAT